MASERHTIGVSSGQVMTVRGPIPVSQMGVTLMHEHLMLDGAKSWKCPCHPDERAIAEQPVSIEIIGELRMNPYMNRDNVTLGDVDLALGEIGRFAKLGGNTVVDPTNIGIGRDPEALLRIAKMSGLNVVMGSGFYLEFSHPEWLKKMDVDAVTEFLVNDVGGGDEQPKIMAGIIGEVGVSKDFTVEERKSLKASARASAITGVPLSIHLPGWERLAHEVLDIVEAEGASLANTVLCHMNPSHNDLPYQKSLAERGAFLEYDMIGMDYYYADQDAQSPSDEENARAIAALVEAGYLDKLLLSQDVFLKIMLTRYGGFGYAYIQRHFIPRLKRHGVPQEAIDRMMTTNPARVFSPAG
ncbi:Aryldialkylphosphatase (Phosphotriesterase-related protein) [Hartmannibacter diazotrophicus]|uniref:Aryldialkylphosphatase (Phosphotriesterase-related protein) n=1 Tax=Hartmannibacter diazotrophicus TaxID=1482074 RepID=A0A2C9D726_9HYPH|nr:phosphotriesterase [Hartmannibacter diazotrophicus]SON55325.1 Aryldialkylphosphatase (Phosphotriesterase-related protein) [Hartmannibacter diazotrophicus]